MAAVVQQPQSPEPVAAPPPPPERGSSYTVMSMRNKETTKRVSFETAPVSVSNTPSTLQLEETIREDPNVSSFLNYNLKLKIIRIFTSVYTVYNNNNMYLFQKP